MVLAFETKYNIGDIIYHKITGEKILVLTVNIVETDDAGHVLGYVFTGRRENGEVEIFSPCELQSKQVNVED